MELSIIMINYNTPELTAQAVESILKTTHQVSYEILVIDNSSERDKEYRPEALPKKPPDDSFIRRLSDDFISNRFNP